MRQLRFSVIAALLATSACVVRTNAPSTQPAAPPPPPSAFTHPGYTYYSAPNQPPPVAPRMPPAVSVQDPVNITHLRAVASQPFRCDLPREVAPGVFVHLDCFPYKRVTVARKHASPLKLDLMKLGQLKWNPRAAVRSFAPGTVGNDAQTYPDLVDHRLNGTEGPVKNQGAVGACTAFALSSVLDNALRRANKNITTSPQHMWSRYGYPTMEHAAAGTLNQVITTNEAMPYSGREACQLMRDSTDDCGEAYNVRPNTAASNADLQQRLRTANAVNSHRPVGFEELEVSPPNIAEIVATLASGADLWVAFHIDSGTWVSSAIKNGVIPDWFVPNGGHAVALAGYRKVNGGYQFLVHNSWGASWGDGGYAWVSQAMVERHLHLAYKVRSDAEPAQRTDEDCPGDQVLDTATNACAGICPDRSRPTNGQCAGGAPAPAPSPLTLPGLGTWNIPGMPAIPGWPPQPPNQQPQPPNQQPQPPNQQPQPPNQQPAWPWALPTNIPIPSWFQQPPR